jgi:hypothetical protein
MADKKVSVQVGPNFFGLLTIVFITLKLTGYINWSWWWVLAPLWGSVALALVIMVIVLVVAFLMGKFK